MNEHIHLLDDILTQRDILAHIAMMWVMYRSGGMVPHGKASQVALGRGGNWTAREEKGGVSFGEASRGA